MRLIIDIDDETFKNVTFYGTCWLCPRDKENLEKSLKNARLIEERAKGKWIDYRASNGLLCAKCSECKTSYGFMKTPFCPNCGADMRGDR